jgi:hypothetical protein
MLPGRSNFVFVVRNSNLRFEMRSTASAAVSATATPG